MVIIYCILINDVLKVYNFLIEEVLFCVYYVDLYYLEIEDIKKDFIINELKELDSKFCILVLISVLGMGIDVKCFNSVILYGV